MCLLCEFDDDSHPNTTTCNRCHHEICCDQCRLDSADQENFEATDEGYSYFGECVFCPPPSPPLLERTSGLKKRRTFKHTPETLKRMSSAQKGHKRTEAQRHYLSTLTNAGGCIRKHSRNNSWEYRYTHLATKHSRSFSFSSWSGKTSEQAYQEALAFQKQTFPDLFPLTERVGSSSDTATPSSPPPTCQS